MNGTPLRLPVVRGHAANPRQSRAFTMVEALVVVVLLAIVAATLVGPISAADGSARFAEAQRLVLELDRLARCGAKSQGPMRLHVSREEGRLHLTLASGEAFASRTLPRSVEVAVSIGDLPVDGVTFDSLGGSENYFVTITQDRHARVLGVCGRSGHAREILP